MVKKKTLVKQQTTFVVDRKNTGLTVDVLEENSVTHFESETDSGFRDDVSVILIDKTDGYNLLKEKRTECEP